MADPSNRPLVFLSHAHADRAFLDAEVMPFLRAQELNDELKLWDDQLIGVGDNWYAEIADRLDEAAVAILLVTPQFLASAFCKREEIPVLLQRARRGELRVLPLYAEPSLWQTEPWLARVRMWPNPDKALSEHRRPQRQRLMAEFTQRVLEAVRSPAQPEDCERRFDAPHPRYDLHRLPKTGSLLFGRREEIRQLDAAWDGGKTQVVAFTAGGGVGKSTLVRVWAEMLAEDEWRGAQRAYAWSFYSQGTGRLTDSETFFNDVLTWFGAKDWGGRSLWDRADALVECLQRERTLLLLDGVEPMQSGEEVDRGSLRDPGLRTLLEELARRGHPGLCVVTTRERLADLADAEEPAVLHYDLDRVSSLSGRALLRVDRVRGEDAELEAAVEDLYGQALAVSLLGNLLRDGGGTPHVSGAKALPALRYSLEEGGHPRRVLDAWEQRLGEGPELELLHLVGLFDRPADPAALRAVVEGEEQRGLNKHLRTADFDSVVARLRDAGLLARASSHDDAVDTHPIVREHFGARLYERHPKSWVEGHRRLYEHLVSSTEERPDTLAEMQPLFSAVAHGCAAGLRAQVFDDVYHHRLVRGGEDYLVKRLGAFAADLSCLSLFFDERWSLPWSGFSAADQSWALSTASYLLQGLGRLREALEPVRNALVAAGAAEDPKNAGIRAGRLSDILLALGDLSQAEAVAREAVELANTSRDGTVRMLMLTTHAYALHHIGHDARARSLFIEAERIQAEVHTEYPLLYSLQGYRYCDLLLAVGDASSALQRATQTLEWATVRGMSPLSIALDHLTLGRAHLQVFPPDFAAAESCFRAAVDGLRAAGAADHIPRGFLARAAFHRLRDDLPFAHRDLDAAQTIILRSGLRLFEADLALERTRCRLAQHDRDAAGATLQRARELIEAMNYGRRRPELVRLEEELAR